MRVRWASAGHLPPVLRHPDGHAELIEEPSEVLLGTLVRATRTDHEIDVPDGGALLFYTDGLIERRGESIDVGLERLRAAVGQSPVGDCRALCAALVEALVPEAPDDDVVVLAVRRRDGVA
jgi:serine phosphatase RsbU (regulator of sigma subunit)